MSTSERATLNRIQTATTEAVRSNPSCGYRAVRDAVREKVGMAPTPSMYRKARIACTA